eukprot:4445739-Prymnesium_polylepis.1
MAGNREHQPLRRDRRRDRAQAAGINASLSATSGVPPLQRRGGVGWRPARPQGAQEDVPRGRRKDDLSQLAHHAAAARAAFVPEGQELDARHPAHRQELAMLSAQCDEHQGDVRRPAWSVSEDRARAADAVQVSVAAGGEQSWTFKG